MSTNIIDFETGKKVKFHTLRNGQKAKIYQGPVTKIAGVPVGEIVDQQEEAKRLFLEVTKIALPLLTAYRHANEAAIKAVDNSEPSESHIEALHFIIRTLSHGMDRFDDEMELLKLEEISHRFFQWIIFVPIL